ncbi:hypothetical protein AXF42_Ash001751 [Apostasia shenzhenica]|uniref:RHOMBOID-like protein n=1 Tax=Apostasia shenzhenica TaxID=1088818 RepID=A0A2I0AB51_9ASPA|nr:hypothetical protein AXF42_Ash001751 [Apostasia shenzhenica]
MLSELITNWTLYTNKVAAILTLLLIVAINLAIGIFPLVNNFAHVGGFIVGFLLGFVLLIRPQFDWIEGQSHPKYKFYQRLLWMMGILMLITGCRFVIGIVLLFKGVNGSEHCHWCGYLNCVPTSKWSCGD